MAEFNPDEYLAKKTQFNPDAYLAKKSAEQAPTEQAPPPLESSAAEAALQGFGQGGTLGYLPELQAGLAKVLEPETPYAKLKEYFGQRNTALKEEHPSATLAGQLGGAIASAPLSGMAARGALGAIPGATAIGEGLGAIKSGAEAIPLVGKAIPTLGAVGEQAAIGAGYGAAMNPEGGSRLENAETGAVVGGALGAGGQGIKAGIKKYLSMTSGVPEKAISGYLKYKPEVQSLIANEGGADYATQVHGELQDAFFNKKREIGAALAKQIGGADNLTVTNKIFAPIEEHINKLSKSEIALTKEGQDEISALKNYVSGIREGLPDQIKPETVWDLKDRLYQASKVPYNGTKSEKQIAAVAKKAHDVAKEELNTAAKTAGLNAEYSKYSKLQDKMDQYFSDPEKTFKTLQGIEAPSKEFARDTARQIKDNLGVDLQKPAQVLEAYRYFRKPEMMPISSGGTTSTTRSMGMAGAGALAGGGLGGAIGGPHGASAGAALGAAAGGALHSPAAIKQYMNAAQAISPYASQIAPEAGQIPYLMSPWLKMKEDQNGR